MLKTFAKKTLFLRGYSVFPVALAVLCLLLFTSGCKDQHASQRDELDDARVALAEKDYIEAEKCFERYLRRYPDGEERWAVWNHMVDLTLDVRQDERMALDMLEAMLIEFGNEPEKLRQVIVRLGEKYHESRRWEASARVWVRMLNDKGASHEEKALAYRRMASAYLRRLEFESAREALGYCLDLDISPESRSMCLYELADALIIMEELDEAEATLRKLLTQPVVSEYTRGLATFMLADVLEQRGKNAEAKVLFESVLNIYPNRKVVEARLSPKKSKLTIIQPVGNDRGPKGSQVGNGSRSR